VSSGFRGETRKEVLPPARLGWGELEGGEERVLLGSSLGASGLSRRRADLSIEAARPGYTCLLRRPTLSILILPMPASTLMSSVASVSP